MKIKSKAQGRLFGAIAGGATTKATGLSKSSAKKHLKGIHMKSLPEHMKRKVK